MANTKWVVDPMHSEMQFKVKRLKITTVTGHLRYFNIEAFTPDEEFTGIAGLVFTADVNPISTNNEQRDTHLKSPDFFDAEQQNEIRFVATGYENAGGNEYKLQGDLSIRDVTIPITVNAEFGGIVIAPYGQAKAGFTVDGKISRKDFGLSSNAVTEAGKVVSDEIRLHAEVQLVKQSV